MPRRPRLHVPGGFYHVTLRGNHRQPIFFRESDRARLDETVAESLDVLVARLHAYCWMTNHVHLLVQISDAPLGRLIQRIASRYARIAQASIRTTGHLFERRYHAVLVDADSYLLTLLRYIHLNPVRASLVSKPGDYAWSSHHEYVGSRHQSWVTTGMALGMLSTDARQARTRYLALVENRDVLAWGDGALQTHRDNSQVLGDDAFLARIGSLRWRPRSAKSMDELFADCSRRFDVTLQDLVSPSRNRHLSTARAWLSHQAVAGRVATVSEIGRRLGRTETAIRRLMTRHQPEAE
jgi:putative transposase